MTADLAPRTRAFTLASLAAAYPSDTLSDVARALDTSLLDPALVDLFERARLDPDGLRGDYLDAFDVGRGRVPVYETEYGRMRGLAKGRDLADVAGFYRAFGLDLGADLPEMPDHAAIELEFYALLLHKQELLADDAEGTDIVHDARRKFLAEHLGGFLPALAERAATASPTYGPVLAWVARLVAEECALEAVTPVPLDPFASGEVEGVQCGGCVAIPGLDAPTAARPR